MNEVLGDLNRVNQVVDVLEIVNVARDFQARPKIINGFSDVIVKSFGEKGHQGRSAVNMGALPFGITVEIEAIVEVGP